MMDNHYHMTYKARARQRELLAEAGANRLTQHPAPSSPLRRLGAILVALGLYIQTL